MTRRVLKVVFRLRCYVPSVLDFALCSRSFHMKLSVAIPVLVLLAAAAYAQFGATVLGTVTDNSGSAVPHATVHLINTQTGVSEKASTDDNGEYRFLSVAVGRYRITVQTTGFKTASTEEFAAD